MSDIIEKFKKGHEGDEITKHEGNFSLMAWATAASLLRYPKILRYYPKKDFGPLMFLIKGDHGIGFFSFDSYKKFTEITLNKYLRDKKEFIELKDWEEFEKKVDKDYNKNSPDEISKLKDNELLKLVRKSYGMFRGAQLITLFCEALNEEIVKKYFDKVKGDSNIAFQEFFEVSSLICFDSFVSQLDKNLINFSKKNLYGCQWMLGNYLITPEVEEVEKLIKKMVSERGGIQKLREEQEKLSGEISENKKIVGKFKEKLNGKLKDLFEFTQLSIELRDVRKKTFFKIITLASNSIREMFLRLGLKKEDAFYALFFDFDDEVYREEDYKEIIEKRKKGFLTYFDEKGHLGEFVDFEKTKKQLFDLMDSSFKKDEVSGSIGCKGVGKGNVKVVLSKGDFSKFNSGDVLVASMTRPEFVPLMKKASAVITDEGGITCHAAIISRELKIPCIIGTKNATRVLKDGMMVEVNANHGYIKILNE